MSLPSKCEYLIIGGGIHGLSTAWHLCKKLSSKGQLKEDSVVVIEKTQVGEGATSVACGIVRNNYYQPAMRRLMAHSVDVWNSNAEVLQFRPVGYMQINSQLMHEGMAEVYSQQKEIGYDSTFIEGAADCDKYMKDLLPDWQAQGITSVLHEKNSGYGPNRGANLGFKKLAETAGAKILEGVQATNLVTANGSGAVSAVETNQGTIECTQLVVAAGPWVRTFWEMLDLPKSVKIKQPDGTFTDEIPMWSYMALEEGELDVDPHSYRTSKGTEYPVIHVDTESTLVSNKTGDVIQFKTNAFDKKGNTLKGIPIEYSFTGKSFDKSNTASGLILQDGRFVGDVPGKYILTASFGNASKSNTSQASALQSLNLLHPSTLYPT